MRQHPLCCGNSKCQTTQTPLWRKGWFSHEGKTVMLCNACGLHYKKGHYCMYCHQIYRESDADDYANPWIGCDRCSRWVHQKCEEANGHHWKQHKAYLCPDCRCTTPAPESTATPVTTSPIAPTTTTNPGSQMGKSKSSKTSSTAIKKRRRTPCGSRNESPTTPTLVLPHHRALQLSTKFSPSTPVSPLSPGSNFILFNKNEPTTPTNPIFDPNINTMPCWNQLQSSISTLPATPVTPSSPSSPSLTNIKKRKLDSSTLSTTTKKKSRTTTTITTTTTHRVANTAGIDALMGAVTEKSKEETVPHLDLHFTSTVRKGKQTSRKMNADARSAAIASSTDTPTTPTFFSPPLFATTMTTTTTTVVPSVEPKSNASLSEEQFYQYQQLIMQQQNGQQSVVPIANEDGGEMSDESSASTSSAKLPATIMQNTLGTVDKLGNFFGSFNEEAEKKQDASPYGMLVDGDEDYEVISSDKRRPQKRMRRTSPKKVTTTTTTLTMTTTVSRGPPVKSKRVRDRIAKNGGTRVVYTGTSSDTEDSEYEPDQEKLKLSKRWQTLASALNISIDDASSVLETRFPKAPVLQKIGSLWAICEVIRVQEQRSE